MLRGHLWFPNCKKSSLQNFWRWSLLSYPLGTKVKVYSLASWWLKMAGYLDYPGTVMLLWSEFAWMKVMYLIQSNHIFDKVMLSWLRCSCQLISFLTCWGRMFLDYSPWYCDVIVRSSWEDQSLCLGNLCFLVLDRDLIVYGTHSVDKGVISSNVILNFLICLVF